MMLMQFGQFVDHDVAHVPFNEELDCCTDAAWDSKEAEDCFTIHIPSNDPFAYGRSSVDAVEDLDHSSPRPTKRCIVVMHHSTADIWCIQCHVNHMTLAAAGRGSFVDYGEFAEIITIQHDYDN